MALRNPVTIRIKLAANARLGRAMNDVRSWLDGNKIEPAGFKPITDDAGLWFEICFRSVDEADLFKSRFSV